MANHASALKRARQNEKRRQRNASRKTRMRNLMKKIRAAVDNKDRETAEQTLQEAMPRIYRAGSKGVIHKRTASRQISRLMKYINTLQENPQ